MTGVPHESASIITSPNGSSHSIGNRSAGASASSSRFCGPSDLADVADPVAVDAGPDGSGEVLLVGRVDLAGQDQPAARPLGGIDRPRGALLRREAAEEQQVAAGSLAERKAGDVDAVVDRRSIAPRAGNVAALAADSELWAHG